MFGNKGADTYIVTNNGGSDVIVGFETGTDVLQISANVNGLTVSSAADLASRVSADGDGNAVLDLGAGNQITFTGLEADDVIADISTIIQIV